MSSYRGEGRKSSRASGSRFRDDVRLGNNSDDSRRFEGYQRGRGGFFNHHPDMENDRKVIVDRDDNIIVKVTNDLYQDPNFSTSRRSQANNRSSATLSQPRNRFEATGKNRSRPFREGAFNGLEQPVSLVDWKPDASAILVHARFQAGLRGNSRNRTCPPVWASGDWNRSSGFRRGGGGVGSGSGRIRRRRGSGDGTKTPFRARDELVSDRDKEISERPRGGLRRRGGPQGLRSGRRGGAIRGSTKFFQKNTRGAHANRLEVEETEDVESAEDSNSTDDYQYRSNVDLKEADNLRRVCEEDPVQREGTEEHVNGGLNIVVGSHQDESVDSREGEESEEESEDEDEDAVEAEAEAEAEAEKEESFKVADGGSESSADGDTSERSKEETQASEVLEENVSEGGLKIDDSELLIKESVEGGLEEAPAPGDKEDPAVESIKPPDEEADNLRRVCEEDPVQREGTEEHVNGGLNIVVGSHQDESVDSREGEESEEESEDEDEDAVEAEAEAEAEKEESFKVADGGSESSADGDTSERSKEETQASEVLENESTSMLTTLEANKAEDIDKDFIVSDGSNEQEQKINSNAATSDGNVRQTVMSSPPRGAGVKAEESSTE